MFEYNGVKYLTPQEASDTLKIPRPTIYQWCRNQRVEIMPPDKSAELKAVGLIDSQYLIEVDSLLERHRKVHLGE